jgi:hypothetical protein
MAPVTMPEITRFRKVSTEPTSIAVEGLPYPQHAAPLATAGNGSGRRWWPDPDVRPPPMYRVRRSASA